MILIRVTITIVNIMQIVTVMVSIALKFIPARPSIPAEEAAAGPRVAGAVVGGKANALFTSH